MYKRLLVAFDGSKLSHKILNHACTVAKKFGSELKILTVIPNQPIFIVSDIISQIVLLNQENEVRPKCTKILVNAEAYVRVEYPDMNVTGILKEGRPSAKIVEVAEKDGCDIIIMGCRKMGSIMSLLGESTSHSVIGKSKIPIMIIT